MTIAYAVRDVSAWEVAAAEPVGLDEKDWLREPETGDTWLFKPVTVHDGWSQGEDWSEKTASEIGLALGVPCARVDLAVREGRRGSISKNLRPSGWAMHSGSDVLAGIVPNYRSKQFGRTGHTLANVAVVLEDCQPPPGTRCPPGFLAFDVFAGYMTFDALVANRDRHDQNWSILQSSSGGSDALAGSYDHASSLGFNLSGMRSASDASRTPRSWRGRGRERRGGSNTLPIGGRRRSRRMPRSRWAWRETPRGASGWRLSTR